MWGQYASRSQLQTGLPITSCSTLQPSRAGKSEHLQPAVRFIPTACPSPHCQEWEADCGPHLARTLTTKSSQSLPCSGCPWSRRQSLGRQTWGDSSTPLEAQLSMPVPQRF